MSEKESTFLKRLQITLISTLTPFALIIIWGLITTHFDVKANTKAVNNIQEHYMTTQDFYIYHDNLVNFFEAKYEENEDDIKRLETELDDFRNQFGIKTRGPVKGSDP